MTRPAHSAWILVGLILATACVGPPGSARIAATLAPPTAVRPTPPPTAPAQPLDPLPTGAGSLSPATGAALTPHIDDLFATAGVCVTCHQGNLDQAGNDVSNGEYWRSTMMANAARDPYYLAGVSTNTTEFPEYADAIETKCSTCHAPMAHFTDAAEGQDGVLFGDGGYLDPQHPLGVLAWDGVSCTACHQIQDEGLGDFASFSGGGVLDTQTPLGSRVVFGPFEPHPSGVRMMSRHTGFIPQQSDHIQESELCATCHNLYTNYVTQDGTFSEEWFPEQTPYSEWLASDHADQTSCQGCHMPPAEGAVALANMGPLIMREPYARHSFVGGNTTMLGVLRDFGGELGVQAGTEHFDATIDRALQQLQTQTARVSLTTPEIESTTLRFDVTTQVWTGHKFPAGYPSRRAWLHVTITDSGGQTIFESGAAGSDGAIAGNDNDADTSAYEPHYHEITDAGQVQIYEAIMQDVRGDVTTVLLAAAGYAKDNRLLPRGFEKAVVTPDIAPQGRAMSDEDFSSGGDTVSYRVDTGDTAGPFSITVELLYQSIAFRWAQDIGTYETAQAQAFTDYINALPGRPVVVAAQSTQSK